MHAFFTFKTARTCSCKLIICNKHRQAFSLQHGKLKYVQTQNLQQTTSIYFHFKTARKNMFIKHAYLSHKRTHRDALDSNGKECSFLFLCVSPLFLLLDAFFLLLILLVGIYSLLSFSFFCSLMISLFYCSLSFFLRNEFAFLLLFRTTAPNQPLC